MACQVRSTVCGHGELCASRASHAAWAVRIQCWQDGLATSSWVCGVLFFLSFSSEASLSKVAGAISISPPGSDCGGAETATTFIDLASDPGSQSKLRHNCFITSLCHMGHSTEEVVALRLLGNAKNCVQCGDFRLPKSRLPTVRLVAPFYIPESLSPDTMQQGAQSASPFRKDRQKGMFPQGTSAGQGRSYTASSDYADLSPNEVTASQSQAQRWGGWDGNGVARSDQSPPRRFPRSVNLQMRPLVGRCEVCNQESSATLPILPGPSLFPGLFVTKADAWLSHSLREMKPSSGRLLFLIRDSVQGVMLARTVSLLQWV